MHWCLVTHWLQLFVTPWTAARQAFWSFTISWSLLKRMSIESMMPSNLDIDNFLLTGQFFDADKLHSCISSVHFSCSVVSNSLRPHKPQHARPPCPSPTPGVYPNSCPLSRWCHPTISSAVVPFSSCPQSFPASRSFPMSQPFTSGGQSIGV